MPNTIVKLYVDDSSYNQKIKNAASAFMGFVGQVSGAKGSFGALTKAIQESTVAQEALNAVMAKNPMGAVMTLATAAATKLLSKLTEVSEEQQRIAEAAEERAERERHENETVINSVAKVVEEYEMMRQKWATLSDEHSKAQWLNENKKKFQQLGMAVNDVKTAEDVFVNNTQAVCNALIARAKAEAYGELYKEQLKKKVANIINPSVDNGRRYKKLTNATRPVSDASMAGVTDADINWVNQTYTDESGKEISRRAFGSYKQSGLDKINHYRHQNALAIRSQDDQMLNLLAMDWATSQQDYERQMRALGIWTNPNGGGGGRGGRGGRNTPAKEAYVPQAGTPDYVKAQISALQGMVGQTENESERNYILMWIESLKAQYKEMTTLPKLSTVLDTSNLEEQHGPLYKMTEQLKELRKVLEDPVDSAEYQYALQLIAEKEKEISDFKGEGNTPSKKKKDSGDNPTIVGGLSTLGQGMNQMVSGIEQLGIDVPEGIKSAVNGISTLVSIVSGIATVLVAIEALTAADTFIPFAGGGVARAANGVVAGRTFSGDKIPAMLNAGEVVLNRAQVGNLASQFNDVGLQNLRLETVVTGTQLRFVLNNESQSRGRGQYVTTNFNR